MRILLVEDEPAMSQALRDALSRQDMVVDHLPTLAEADAALRDSRGIYDAVLLDRQLPDGDGLALVGTLRASGNTVPLLVLTARGDLGERVLGLDGGADDYLGKPFAFEELLARRRAILRRPPQLRPDIVAAGHIGCIQQLQSGLDYPVVHTVELLDWAHGGPVPRGLEGLAEFSTAVPQPPRSADDYISA